MDTLEAARGAPQLRKLLQCATRDARIRRSAAQGMPGDLFKSRAQQAAAPATGRQCTGLSTERLSTCCATMRSMRSHRFSRPSSVFGGKNSKEKNFCRPEASERDGNVRRCAYRPQADETPANHAIQTACRHRETICEWRRVPQEKGRLVLRPHAPLPLPPSRGSCQRPAGQRVDRQRGLSATICRTLICLHTFIAIDLLCDAATSEHKLFWLSQLPCVWRSAVRGSD